MLPCQWWCERLTSSFSSRATRYMPLSLGNSTGLCGHGQWQARCTLFCSLHAQSGSSHGPWGLGMIDCALRGFVFAGLSPSRLLPCAITWAVHRTWAPSIAAHMQEVCLCVCLFVCLCVCARVRYAGGTSGRVCGTTQIGEIMTPSRSCSPTCQLEPRWGKCAPPCRHRI
jgi:hypothetical protein